MLDFALSISTDIQSFFVEWGPTILVVVGLIIIFMYGLAYLARYFEYLKMHESRYFDRRTLDITRTILQWVWVGILALCILIVSSLKSENARNLLTKLNELVPALLFVVVVSLTTVLLVSALKKFAEHLQTSVHGKKEGVVGPEALGFAEIFFKYLIYVLGGLIATLGGLALVPDLQQWVSVNVLEPVQNVGNWPLIVGLLTIVGLVAFVVSRLISSLFEDLKNRSKKFSPRVIVLFKSLALDMTYFVAGLVSLFLVLSIFLQPVEITAAALILVVIFVAIILMARTPLRNALSGISLMIADPFDEGDRVKILDDLVCDIEQMNLSLTQVKTLKGEVVNIPNNRILESKIFNFSRSHEYAMTVEVSVSYEVPSEKIRDLLLEAAEKTNGIVDDPKPTVFAKKIEGNTIVHQLLAYITDTRKMKRVRSDLIYNIQRIFYEKGIRRLASSSSSPDLSEH